MIDAIDRATDTVAGGGLIAYPTETVYGLGADATNPAAVERVFEAKRRSHGKPVSMAVPDIDQAAEHVRLSRRERRFANAFLPGPVTLVCARREGVPDILTAGRDRVGIRIPDHRRALALLARTPPLTATSANVSGRPSALRADELDSEIRAVTDVVLPREMPPADEDPVGSTVVDVARGEIHREGAQGAAVEAWLETH
ncbi:MAG: sua5/YciO/YrdC/YwlC family protein [halophilic archaeon J07HX5]|jgi:translation factor SUA5|nr:MAG: sua5/YciO/YrdC/YwlC family protein [halophilic archaeon J07HX5]